MIKLAWIAALSLLIGACASSAPEAPVAPAAPAPEAEATTETDNTESSGSVVEASAEAMAATDPNEVICRREIQTGSRFATRVCRTRAEIEAREAKDQEAMNQIRSGTSGSHCALNRGC